MTGGTAPQKPNIFVRPTDGREGNRPASLSQQPQAPDQSEAQEKETGRQQESIQSLKNVRVAFFVVAPSVGVGEEEAHRRDVREEEEEEEEEDDDDDEEFSLKRYATSSKVD